MNILPNYKLVLNYTIKNHIFNYFNIIMETKNIDKIINFTTGLWKLVSRNISGLR